MKLAAVILASLLGMAGIASADDYAPADPYAGPQVQNPQRQELRQRRRLRREKRMEKRISKLIAKYDLNHDGVVDQAEMPPRARRLQRLDRNHDGWLDQADIALPPRRR